jgi:hypothetical protein
MRVAECVERVESGRSSRTEWAEGVERVKCPG